MEHQLVFIERRAKHGDHFVTILYNLVDECLSTVSINEVSNLKSQSFHISDRILSINIPIPFLKWHFDSTNRFPPTDEINSFVSRNKIRQSRGANLMITSFYRTLKMENFL